MNKKKNGHNSKLKVYVRVRRKDDNNQNTEQRKYAIVFKLINNCPPNQQLDLSSVFVSSMLPDRLLFELCAVYYHSDPSTVV